tara:strand:- start:259 stop:720 length:462 start_codon:yes stop_codon:yes gene_type:complete
MGFWKRYLSIAAFLYLFMIISLTLHEMGHAWAATLGGATPTIEYFFSYGFPIAGYTHYNSIDNLGTVTGQLFDLAGGLFAAAILILIGICGRVFRYSNLELVSVTIAIQQVFYGVAEGLLNNRNLLIQLIALLGFILGLLLFHKRWWHWIIKS